jgi:ABC-type antimicrobial peptide transport system permease subunit
MSEQVRTTMSAERMFALLTAGFGVLALTLACVGIYGVMAYAVTSRTSEIGIRLALGASRSRVLTAVLREASWLSLAGVALGIVGALLCTRLIRSMLFGVAPDDPASMAGAAVLLLVVGLVASWLPAWRAASVEPMVALRCE